MTFFRAFGVLLAAKAASSASSSCSSNWDATELLQSQISKVATDDAMNASQAALRELAEMLHKAKKECRMKQSQNCLPLLQDLRKRMWPYVLGELAETGAGLDFAPNKILEDRVPKPAIFRAALKPKLCNGKGQAMYFVDLTETKNKGLLQDLSKVSRGHLKLRSKNAKVKSCKNLVPKGEPRQRQNTFVLIRDPLARFISGYAAIEKELRQKEAEGLAMEEYQFLSEAKNNLTKRATLFLHRFFKDGANYSSHVSSMSEYVGSVSSTCRELPKQWFAKVENATQTWTMFLKRRGCKKALESFTSFNTTERGGKYEVAMSSTIADRESPFTPSDNKIFVDGNASKASKASKKSLLSMDAAESSYGMVMSQLMGLNNYAALRELAEMLHKAKKECRMKQSQNCLPLLQDLRKRMWPYVLGELAETGAGLDFAPNKILEDRVPKPAIFRAALKPKLCKGKGQAMYFVDLTETKNKGLLQDLSKVSRGHLKLRSKNAKVKSCKNLVPKGEPRQRQNTFVLMRDPLARFISGYAAIEKELRQKEAEGLAMEEYQFLSEAKNNLTKRATLFLHRFFKDGANYSSHVSSMSEYVGSVSSTCRELPKQWFAKVENATQTWTMFLKRRGCKKALESFTSFNTTERGGKYEVAMSSTIADRESPFTPSDNKIFVDGNASKASKASKKSLLSMDAAESSYGMVMSQLMGLNNYVYLRAFCWLSLPDYVIFDYGLPQPCHREDMDVILKLSKQKVEEDPLMNPGKKNKQNKKNKRKQGLDWSKVMIDPMVEKKEKGPQNEDNEGDGI